MLDLERGRAGQSGGPAANWFAPYIGLPFGEGAGQVTCWALVRRVYLDHLGIDLPAYGEVSARDLIGIARAMHDGAAREAWVQVDAPQVFDVVGMRAPSGGRIVVHVGVMVDPHRVLHVEQSTAAVVVGVRHWSVARRIAGFWRHGAVCCGTV